MNLGKENEKQENLESLSRLKKSMRYFCNT